MLRLFDGGSGSTPYDVEEKEDSDLDEDVSSAEEAIEILDQDTHSKRPVSALDVNVVSTSPKNIKTEEAVVHKVPYDSNATAKWI